MTLLDVMEVKSNGKSRQIELHQGDLTDLTAEDAVDVLIISAFPDDYTPSRTSLIGALQQKGLSVADLARHKQVDLRSAFSCWLSDDIRPTDPGIQFDRILCFEPTAGEDPADLVGNIFRALTPFLGGDTHIRSAAMPIVAGGDQGCSHAAILPPLVEAAVQWMRIGVPLDILKIFAYSDAAARDAQRLFADLKLRHAQPQEGHTRYQYDVFISYARADAEAAQSIKRFLEDHKVTVFIDVEELEQGAAWQHHIFSALDSCARMIAIYSPAYVQSKVCQEEFNIAWARGRKLDTNIIYPIYWDSAALPTYMELLNYVDCRHSGQHGLEAACQVLIDKLIEAEA